MAAAACLDDHAVMQRNAPDPAGADVRRLLLTRAEHAEHLRELDRLRAVRDHDLPAQMREARTFVTADAIEESARLHDELTWVRTRIATLENLLANATILPDGEAHGVVSLGSVLQVRFPRTGRVATYQLTGTGGGAGTVSARSPVGQALMGARAGDVVRAQLPGGHTEELEVVAVEAMRRIA
jgi:transcription elongation factor GreA